jgi:hypothetical protein
MNANNYYMPLDFSYNLINNINRLTEQNDNETYLHNYENKNINPPFRYYLDDANLNLTPSFLPLTAIQSSSRVG